MAKRKKRGSGLTNNLKMDRLTLQKKERESVDEKRVMRRYRFNTGRDEIATLLKNSYRQGINCNVQGFHRQAPSDHLPIEANNGPLKMASWNLLADVHLPNNYRNMYAFKVISEDPQITTENTFKNRPHWLLSYIGEYLTQKAKGSVVLINEEVLQKFVDEYPFDNERDEEKAREAARQIMSRYLDPENPNRNDFLASMAHAVEMHYAITEGYLKWESRLPLIEGNQKLLHTLREKDFICFQECTNPEDMLRVLNQNGKNYRMITQRVDNHTNDHCVIIYDGDKYDPGPVEKFGLGLRKDRATNKMIATKPALMAGFLPRDQNNPTPLIIGSIHHPGGQDNEMGEVLMAIKKIEEQMKSSGGPKPEIYVFGDLNHQGKFFEKNLEGSLTIRTTHEGSMAGPDFGSTNMGIDGVLSTQPNVEPKVIPLPLAPPIDLGIKIELSSESNKPKSPKL